jgi:hypothetical protein
MRDPDALRVVWLFGKPYWWNRLPSGRLALVRASLSEEQPVTDLAEAIARMTNHPVPWPSEETADA